LKIELDTPTKIAIYAIANAVVQEENKELIKEESIKMGKNVLEDMRKAK